MQNVYAKARNIRLAIFDVDGVLTDGTLYFGAADGELKAFNVRDGHGMKMLRDGGIELAIITGRQSRAVEMRAKDLGVALLFQNVADKAQKFAELLAARRLDAAAAAYMGDDVVDLPVLHRCGLALTVPDAPLPVRQCAHYVTRARGGRGAVREACELILHAQGALARHIEARRA